MKINTDIKKIIENPALFSGWIYSNTKVLIHGEEIIVYTENLDLSPEEEKLVRDDLIANGYQPLLTIEDIEDIIKNTNDQLNVATVSDYLKAINYFLKHDAYINSACFD